VYVVFLGVVYDPIRLAVHRRTRARGLLLEYGWLTGDRRLSDAVVAKLHNCLVGVQCALRLHGNDHVACERPRARPAAQPRCLSLPGRHAGVALRDGDLFEGGRVGLVVDVGESSRDDEGACARGAALSHPAASIITAKQPGGATDRTGSGWRLTGS